MIIDGRAIDSDAELAAEMCIVGAGAAGIALALQFLNAETSVILLESGDTNWNDQNQELADFEVVGPPYFAPRESRIRAFGGTTGSWGGICTMLDQMDFIPRSWVPNSGWPISHHDLAPYYEPALRLCNANSRGYCPTEDLATENGVMWTRMFFSPPTRFGDAFVSRFRSSTTSKCILNSSATELRLHPDGNCVEGIHVKCIGGNRFVIRAKNFILACGGIDNPRLLLASNRVATKGVGNGHDQVGRYFMEHPRVNQRFRLASGKRRAAVCIPEKFAKLRFSRLQLTEEIQRNEKLLNYQANLSLGYSGQNSDQWESVKRIYYAIRNQHSPFYPGREGGQNRLRMADLKTVLNRLDRSILALAGTAFQPNQLRSWIEIQSSVEQPPLPGNRIVLSRRRDKLGVPVATMIWSISDLEKRTFERGLELVLQKLENFDPGISRQLMDKPNPWPEKIFGTWHHMGTTRMHHDPRQGVVDANCRVHGVNNLYIAGSSVFSTGGVHSPTLPIIALALRLADHIKKYIPGP